MSSVKNNCSSNNNSNNNHNNNHMMSSNSSNFTMNLHLNKMQSLDINVSAAAAAAAAATATPASASPSPSPPDFDFSIPCRYFKSSFARSLSLNSASNHCRSLDYDVRGKSSSGSSRSNESNARPSLPQRPSRSATPAASAAAAAANANESNNERRNSGSNVLPHNKVSGDNNKPPAIPARRLSAAACNPELPRTQSQQQQHVSLTQFRPAAASSSSHAAAASARLNRTINQQQQQQQQPHEHHPLHRAANGHCSSGGSSSSNNSSNNNRNNNRNNNHNNNHRGKTVWPREGAAGEQDFELYDAAADLETAGISTGADYSLPAEQQRPPNQQPRALFEPHEEAVNVEAVLLQNQVDTLQWQLKQVETSCEMYRAVMEEVARFLDRYHNQRQQQLLQRSSMEQITRSKSLHHVYGGGGEGGGGEDDDDVNVGYEKLNECKHDPPAAACFRTRSSTNLIDAKQSSATTKAAPKKTKPPKGSVIDDHLYDVIAPSRNYADFKDYTWRRSPRKLRGNNTLCSDADAEEKLSQEAFRLSRTIRNLLNTSMQQPDLTQHRSTFAAGGLGRLKKTPASASITTLNQPLLSSTILTTAGSDSSALDGVEAKGSSAASAAATTEVLFLRSMRGSRLSLRSSTDSSVHSTSSSSKLETDEEHSPFSPPPSSHAHSAPTAIPHLGSTTEDESGFSSISSFQDIGVPLSSTMISPRDSLANAVMTTRESSAVSALDSNTFAGLDLNVDSRNSTLKAAAMPPSTPTHPSNEVGVPLNAAPDMQHRWDSPAKTYRSAPNRFQQRFSTLSNDDSSMVLWV